MSGVIAGLDIGTSKIRVVVGECNDNGTFEIIGVGSCLSTGLQKGIIRNIDVTCNSVKAAVESAEIMSGRDIETLFVGIGGPNIESVNSKGVAAVTGKNRSDREISEGDIARSVEQATAVPIPMYRKMIHVLPRGYIVDEQTKVKNPTNMIGVRLECEVHIITASVDDMQKVVHSVRRAGYELSDIGYNGYAAGVAVLNEDEKDLGCVLIDIGGGTTDVLVYKDGQPVYTSVLPYGGIQVTNDISAVHHISSEMADRVKLECGCCWLPLIEKDEPVIISGVTGMGPKEIPRSKICEVIYARMAEIFSLVKDKISPYLKTGDFGGGIVLTGGGALLSGTLELAGEIFGVPARLGVPVLKGGLVSEYQKPDYAAALGLVLMGLENNTENAPVSKKTESGGGKFFNFFNKIIKDFF